MRRPGAWLAASLVVAVLPGAVLTAFDPVTTQPVLSAARVDGSGSATYAYDGAGRLTGVAKDGGGAAGYDYDAAGNIRAVRRFDAGAVAVSSVVPLRGGPGAVVTISGTGFAASPAANTVRFAGRDAAVSAASATSLTVVVPAGAESGPVTVVTGAGTASSDRPFTVEKAGAALSVTSFSPSLGGAGTPVTISGAGFDGVPENNTVTFGTTRAKVTAATASSLTVLVPGSASSGRITVGTQAGGTVTSATDFVVVPGGSSPDTIATTDVLTVDGAPTSVMLSDGNKSALLRFSGRKGQRLSFGLTGMPRPSTVYAAAFTPFGAPFARDEFDRGRWVDTESGGYELPPLPTSGTYLIKVTPVIENVGTIVATLSNRITGTIALDGTGTTVALGRAGQHAELSIPVTKGQTIGLGFTGSSFGKDTKLSATVREPNGTPVLRDQNGGAAADVWLNGGGDDEFVADSTGTYTVLLGTPDQSTGSVTVFASLPRSAGTLSAGISKALTVDRPGQDLRLAYDGLINQELGIDITDFTMSYQPYVTVAAADGTVIWRDLVPGHVDLPPLPSSGTFTVTVSAASETGSMTFRLNTRRRAGSISATGPAVAVTIPSRGASGELTFPARKDTSLSFAFTNWGLPESARLRARLIDSDGDVEDSFSGIVNGDAIWFTPRYSGEYRIQLSAEDGNSSGSVSVTLSGEAVGGVLRPGAVSGFSADRPGQVTRYGFAGTKGQRLSLVFGDFTLRRSLSIRVLRPDGSVLIDRFSWTGIDLDPLPTSGNYQILVAAAGETGTAKLRLAPRSVFDAASVDGPGKELAIGYPGGAAETSFSVGAGKRLSFGFTETDFRSVPVRARVLAPDGAVAADLDIYEGSFLDLTGTVSGVYRLIIAPAAPEYVSSMVTVSEQISAGRLTKNSPKTVTLGRPGQSAWLTFDGTAGQQPTLTFGARTTYYRPYVRVTDPDGAYLTGDNTNNNLVGIGKLPKTGRYEVLINAYGSTGSVTLTLGINSGAGGDAKASHAVDGGAYPPTASSPDRRVILPQQVKHEGVSHLPQSHRATISTRRPAPGAETRAPTPGGLVPRCAPGAPCTGGTAPPPGTAPVPGGGAVAGDPVDLGTGLLSDVHTDLTVPDSLPLSVTRTYQQSDTGQRSFGFGVSLDYDMYLHSDENAAKSQLILPGGSRIQYHRITATGAGAKDHLRAVYAADPTPTRFNGSIMAWDGNGFDVRLRDGTTLVFGDQAPLREIRDRYGNTITITRAAGTRNPDGEVLDNGPISQVTSPNGRWIRFSHDARSRLTRAEDNSGRAVIYGYDRGGRLATVTDPVGAVSSYTYDASGRMATAKDNRGTVSLTNAYDSAGRVGKQTLGDGGTYLFSYVSDPGGKITETRVTDQRGTVRRLTFDASGLVTSRSIGYGSAHPQTTTITRDTSGLPTVVVDSLGRRTEAGYDTNGDLVTRTELAGTSSARTERFAYAGPYGQLSAHTDPLGRTTTYGYAANGAPRTVTDPMALVTTVDTNETGRPDSITDSLGRTTRYGYYFGDTTSITDPLGHVTKQVTDGAGRVISRVDPLGNTATFGYDATNRMVSVTDPVGASTKSEYDLNGNLVKVVDAGGHATTYTYDPQNRPLSATDPLGRATTSVYDRAGSRVATTDASGTKSTFDYDLFGRMTTSHFGVSGTGEESRTAYAYDDGGRITTITDSAAGTISNRLDGADNIVEQSTPQGRIAYAYDAANQRVGTTVAGQPQTGYTYNANGQLTGLQRGTDTVSIGYDRGKRRSEVRLPNGITQNYAYTDTGQIASIRYTGPDAPIGDLSYTYDGNGRTTHVGGSLANVDLPAPYGPASYNEANHLLQAGDKRYQYDADGNLTSDGTTSYVWNARKQLTKSQSAQRSTEYAYDGLGRRTGKTTGFDQTQFLYDGTTIAAEITGTTLATTLTGGTDETYGRSISGTTRSLLTDALGSAIAVSSPGGQVTAAYDYQPFGATTVTGDDAGNKTRFTGREDEGDGLYFYRARYYSATDQRFLSQDPLGFGAGATNLYTYVGNQPTNLVDPLGMSAQPGQSILAGIGGVAKTTGTWVYDHLGVISVVGGAAAIGLTAAAAIVGAPVLATAAAIAGGIALAASVLDTYKSCSSGNATGCGLGIASLAFAGQGALFAKGIKAMVASEKAAQIGRMTEKQIRQFDGFAGLSNLLPWAGIVADSSGTWGK